jgi:hypothetical protein
MNGSLFLTPQNPESTFSDTGAVTDLLVALGLIEPNSESPYLCGSEFAKLVIFMGCSPHLTFEPPADGGNNYCHVNLHNYQLPRLFTGGQTAPPRCPACRHRIADWKTSINPQQPEWQCPKCDDESDIFHLDWKQSAGAGRFLVEICNIFPGEAVPVDSLMNDLAALTGEAWRYFYTAS